MKMFLFLIFFQYDIIDFWNKIWGSVYGFFKKIKPEKDRGGPFLAKKSGCYMGISLRIFFFFFLNMILSVNQRFQLTC